MKYVVDHDYHIHSRLSSCSRVPEQTPEKMLEYAKENGYCRIVVTDHFWDENVAGASPWYAPQNYDHVRESLPLPKADGVEFLFGVETEMTKDNVVAISRERCNDFAFIIIPIGHFHMVGFSLSEEEAATAEGRAEKFFSKFEALLAMDLPFRKIGLAHLANDTLGARDNAQYCRVLELILAQEDRLNRIFTRVAELGAGVELNTACLDFQTKEEEAVVRFYLAAKACGCKFYFGSDAHHPADFEGKRAVAERLVDLIGLEETDKFHIGK